MVAAKATDEPETAVEEANAALEDVLKTVQESVSFSTSCSSALRKFNNGKINGARGLRLSVCLCGCLLLDSGLLFWYLDVCCSTLYLIAVGEDR